jgi:hypothetical protein
MFIQFAGYDIEANSRIYNFDVMDPPREAREFTVEIESKMSRWRSLKFQDGPGICFERLRRELERETSELCATSHLQIGEQDVQEYLARQHPRGKAFGHKSGLGYPLNPHYTQVFRAAERPVTGFRT